MTLILSWRVTFINDLSPVKNDLNMHQHNIVIAGDLNINLLEINDKVEYSIFFNLLVTNNLNPQIYLFIYLKIFYMHNQLAKAIKGCMNIK